MLVGTGNESVFYDAADWIILRCWIYFPTCYSPIYLLLCFHRTSGYLCLSDLDHLNLKVLFLIGLELYLMNASI